MMSYEYMMEQSRKAANRARRESKSPKQFSGLGHDAIRGEIKHIPFLGDYCPKRFQRVDAPNPPRLLGCKRGYLFVDSSGFGAANEPALTVQEFVDYVYENKELGFAIVESGQFQVVIATYARKVQRRNAYLRKKETA